MKWFEQMTLCLFPPVTRRMALDIAKQTLAQAKPTLRQIQADCAYTLGVLQ